jgi:hypothetical protein
MKSLFTIVLGLLLSGAVAYAQPSPPPGGGDGGPDQQGGPPGRQDRPQRGGPGGGGPGGGGPGMMPSMGGPGRGGPDGGRGGPDGGPGGGGPMGGPMRQFEMMRSYLDVVDQYTKISTDPTSAGIAAVIAAADVLKPRGPEAAIEYFTKILPEVKDQSISRAIRAQLADLYKQSGQQDKALDQLHSLITGTMPTAEPTK